MGAEVEVSKGINESTEYLHMVAEGVPEDSAWGAAWIDRVYKHLVGSGMDGPQAYAQAPAAWTANGFDLDDVPPEDVIQTVLGMSYKAREQFARLDPTKPATSFLLERHANEQRIPG